MQTLTINTITIKKFCELTGFTENTVRGKRRDGKWLEGEVIVVTPDGNVLIDIRGYEKWARSGNTPAYKSSAKAQLRSPFLTKANAAVRESKASPPPLILN